MQWWASVEPRGLTLFVAIETSLELVLELELVVIGVAPRAHGVGTLT